MKKIILTTALLLFIRLAFGQATADLNGVTFGFAAGYSHTFDKLYDYSLTTDAAHNLKIQPLNRNAFVISSVISVKFSKIATDQQDNTIIKQSMVPAYTSAKENFLADGNKQQDFTATKENAKAGFTDRLSVNLALNLVNVASDVSFNKNIDGGIGLGYFLNENIQLAVFYDVSRVSQLRDYIVNSYQDKPIPTADGKNYNSLDPKDNNLFYNKTVSGLSLKLVYSIASKKPTQSAKPATQDKPKGQ